MTITNLAGNGISIFLFRFVIQAEGINFVLNESIAQDMYPDIDEQIKPLIHACCETLLRYRHLSVGHTMMDGSILADGVFEVMLSTGLGRHFAEQEKQHLFHDAKSIADQLTLVMDRKTDELNCGKQLDQPFKPHSKSPKNIEQGLEELGHKKHLLTELQWLAEGKQIRPGLKQLRPDDLPAGVFASRSYDHRGYCLTLHHERLGELGKIVLIDTQGGQMLIQAELHTGGKSLQELLVKQKRDVFETVLLTIKKCFDEIEVR